MIRKFFIFSLMLLSFSTLNADVVSNKTGFKAVFGVDNNGKQTYINNKDLEGSFTFIWFFDLKCHFCKESLPKVKDVTEWVDEHYRDDIKVMFTSVRPQKFNDLKEYLGQVGLEDKVISYVETWEDLEYMNVNSTPTLIILDPYMNIVDKIENGTNPTTYKRHIRYILTKWQEAQQK